MDWSGGSYQGTVEIGVERRHFLVAHELGATGECKNFTRGSGKLTSMHKLVSKGMESC